MWDEEVLTRRRTAVWRLALPLIAAVLSLSGVVAGRGPESDPVERLRRALQTTYPNVAARDRSVKQCLVGLRSLSDLHRAATLVEWHDSYLEDKTAAVDRVNREAVVEWFSAAVRRVLRQSDPSTVAETLDWLARLAALAHTNGESALLICRFQSELADIVIQGPPSLRGVAARTLAQIEPSVYIGVPALGELLQSGDVELRQTAADGFATLLRNASQAMDRDMRATQRPAPRSALVLTASSILPAVHRGLDDAQPKVRRRCLETIGLAAVALSRLIEDALLPEDQASTEGTSARSLAAAREEVRPLVQALRDQGPILARSLRDDDGEARVLTHRALEELGHAHWSWVRRCAEAGIAIEGSEDDLLHEVLQEAMPGLAAALEHPDMRVRRSALDALEMFGPLALAAAPALIRTLHDPDHFSRWSAIRTLGKLGSAAAPLAIPELSPLLHDAEVDLRLAAATALDRLNASRKSPLPNAK